jgi:hypothetical protein
MLQHYDPHFFHLTRSEHEEAMEWVEDTRKKDRDMAAPRAPVRTFSTVKHGVEGWGGAERAVGRWAS